MKKRAVENWEGLRGVGEGRPYWDFWRGRVENRGFYGKMGFSWDFGQEIGENQGRAGNLRIS